MREQIDAVAFDIDGTLYPNSALYWRTIPFFLKNSSLVLAFGRVRKEIRRWQEANPGEAHIDFFRWQASLMVEHLGGTPESMEHSLNKLIYEGWKPIFDRITPFPYVTECFESLQRSGLKLAILSDFLPEQKGDIWNLAPLCEVVMGSEQIGALKPSPLPFLALSEDLGVPPQRILYVGNSVSSDVQGASGVGMKTACIINPIAHALGRRIAGADISFSSYRKLTKDVLK